MTDDLSRARGDAELADDLEALLTKATPGDWAVVDCEYPYVCAPRPGNPGRMDLVPGSTDRGAIDGALIVFLHNNAKRFIAALRKAGRHDEG